MTPARRARRGAARGTPRQSIDIVLRAVDNGTPPLASYRRVIIQVS